MKPKNIKEFKALVERYETITLEEIKAKWIDDGDFLPGFRTAEQLTGFGGGNCTLCSATRTYGHRNCSLCVYGESLSDHPSCIDSTYQKIPESSTPEELLNAYRSRAKHLRKTYPQYL